MLLFQASSALGRSSTRHQEPQRQPLGSLSSVGQTYLDGTPAPLESTVFSGDTVRTGDDSSAVFTMSGRGSLKMGPQTEVVFAADPRYLAELQSGAIVMNTFAGASDVTIKAGNFIIGPVIQAERSSAQISKHPDGSYEISCLDGSVGLIPIEGAAGRVLGSGQSLFISTTGQLQTPSEAAANAPPAAAPPVQTNNRKRWIILGLLGGGAAVAAGAAAAGGGGGGKPVSPASP